MADADADADAETTSSRRLPRGIPAVVALWWWKFPALRDVDRFSDVSVVD